MLDLDRLNLRKKTKAVNWLTLLILLFLNWQTELTDWRFDAGFILVGNKFVLIDQLNRLTIWSNCLFSKLLNWTDWIIDASFVLVGKKFKRLIDILERFDGSIDSLTLDLMVWSIHFNWNEI